MRGAIPSLPQYAFMAWCSVKNAAQGYLYLLPLPVSTVSNFIVAVEGFYILVLFSKRWAFLNVLNLPSFVEEMRCVFLGAKTKFLTVI
jgi:hypothetical protein